PAVPRVRRLLEQREVTGLLTLGLRLDLVVPVLVLGLRLPGAALLELLVADRADELVRPPLDLVVEAEARSVVLHQLVVAGLVVPVILDVGERVRAATAGHRS